ncbi:hypothetical protein M5X11_37665 [Paenibacillus alginolyticus]|uniref:Uncharacterized protein n=1 Tax=Paenibacillus alginolyticus TaxID=59839 RepID=A0ABT4GNT8_9BACL|nr:hypothetical protein [Paenibacillus alginolyticus]MCY9670553.1 hypothetical protein [Paenibacillus alginolyticus]MCY9697795.1 hypothetical protein [Paenibacillus alginolyticus]MEC0143729.1 hypothetical protein [Paenibacillus alginolyticus]
MGIRKLSRKARASKLLKDIRKLTKETEKVDEKIKEVNHEIRQQVRRSITLLQKLLG